MKKDIQLEVPLGSASLSVRSAGVKRKTQLTESQQLQNINCHLAVGNGRGRLTSAATIYDGKVGYFCVHRVGGEDCIIFACAQHEDIVITALPAHPKYWNLSEAERRTLLKEARQAFA